MGAKDLETPSTSSPALASIESSVAATKGSLAEGFKSARFGFDTTAEQAANELQHCIRGKNVLITGVGLQGIGGETVRAISQYAKTIIIASRSQEKIAEVVVLAKAHTPTVEIRTVTLDLESMDSIKAAAKQINHFDLPIHVVINNAAIAQYSELKRTALGVEAQTAANHLGHFLLNGLIWHSIKPFSTDSPARIVVVASEAHKAVSSLRLEELDYQQPEQYQWRDAYANSKLANVLYAKELAKRYSDQQVIAFSLHPGRILETGLGSAISPDFLRQIGILRPDGTINQDGLKSVAKGASTTIIAAFDPTLVSYSGGYLNNGVLANEELSDLGMSDELAKKLWAFSEKLLGYTFAE